MNKALRNFLFDVTERLADFFDDVSCWFTAWGVVLSGRVDSVDYHCACCMEDDEDIECCGDCGR